MKEIHRLVIAVRVLLVTTLYYGGVSVGLLFSSNFPYFIPLIIMSAVAGALLAVAVEICVIPERFRLVG